MAVTPNPPNQGGNLTPQEQEAREQVRYLDEQAVSLKNLLKLRREVNKAEKEANMYTKLSAKLSAEQTRNARDYATVTSQIEGLEKRIKQAKEQGTVAGDRAAKQLERQLRGRQAIQRDLAKTEGGYVEAQSKAAQKKLMQLEAERKLVRDINKERGIGGRIMDLFRSKEAKQKQIDLARARTGGGANIPGQAGGATGAGGGQAAQTSVFGPRTLAVLGAVTAGVQALSAPLKALGNVAKNALTAPFADAAGLLTGEDFGMGGGKLKTSGPSSILGGIQQVAGSIPLIGGFLSTAVGFVKTIVEGILGIEQGVFRFARAMNISFGEASRMKGDFEAIAASSGHIAINFARMAQSQVELTKQLGINKQLSGDILKNDVLLRDVLGVELGQRQAIANTSIIAGKNAVKLTQSIIGATINFRRLTGLGFSFNGIMEEASKLTGVVGLAFAKYPEKMTRTLMATKALGFELQQMSSIQDGFLNFEESISKEMEAQVITGKEMNLTKAREAALNNDYATLAQEITKYVGKASDFTNMQRIDQMAIAESVHMSADQLADVLKKQELYGRLQATDLQTFHKKVALLEQQGKTQEQISALIGKDAYNAYTQVSTAERISEVIEKVKRTFVEFVAKSGLFDFLTKPEKIENFIKGLADRLASVIDIIGSVIASILRGVAAVAGFFDSETGQNLRNVASSVEYGTSTFAGGLRASTAFLGGQQAPAVGATVQSGARQQQQQQQQQQQATTQNATASSKSVVIHNYMQVDKQTIGKNVTDVTPQLFGLQVT